jgi:hypothetical protein
MPFLCIMGDHVQVKGKQCVCVCVHACVCTVIHYFTLGFQPYNIHHSGSHTTQNNPKHNQNSSSHEGIIWLCCNLNPLLFHTRLMVAVDNHV